MLATMPAAHADRFGGGLSDPAFDIFYRAKALVVISARAEGPWIVEDCALAAGNLMLAACAEGLGTCWIGFAQSYLNTNAGKAAIGAPATWVQVAPIIMGKPAAAPAPVPRVPPEIHWVG
jgi:nitroreductase